MKKNWVEEGIGVYGCGYECGEGVMLLDIKVRFCFEFLFFEFRFC